MVRHGAFQRASLLLIALALAAWPQPAAQGSPGRPAQGTGAQVSRSSSPPASPAQAPTAANAQPPHDPPFDLAPLLDAYRAGKPLPPYSPAAIQRQRGLLPEKAAKPSSATAPAEPAEQPQQGSAGSPPLTKTAGTPRPMQGAGCVPLLDNPTMDNNGLGWPQYDPIVYYTAGPDQALFMIDGADNGDATPQADAVGQDISLELGALGFNPGSLIVELNVGYGAGTVDSFDHNYINLYASGTTQFGGLVYALELPEYADAFFHYVQYTITDPSVIDSLMSATRADFTVDTVTDNLPPSENFYIDNVQVYACPSGAGATITGSWGSNVATDTDLSDALTVLSYVAPDGSQTAVSLTYPDVDGAYAFEDVAPLAGNGDAYQVWYINEGLSPDRLSFWARTKIPALAEGDSVDQGFVLLDNTAPTSPAHGAEVTLPATFGWTGFSDEFYTLCLYDLQDTEKSACSALIDSGGGQTEFVATLADLQGAPSLGFQYNRTYAWYLYIQLSNSDASQDVGSSFESHHVTFVKAIAPPPSGNPGDDGQPLPGETTAQTWTVMVYLAGDNDLGDPATDYDPSSKMTGHFEQLQQIAARYPNIHLVTLSDLYDSSGTQFCHLRPSGVPDCKQLGEQDTSNPQTLTTFVQSALQQFPANRSMLIITDHGHAIYGVGIDDTSHPPSAGAASVVAITPEKLAQALANAGLGPSKKLDVLFFDTCLMGGIEAAHNLSGVASYMVSGTDTLWMVSFYDRVLDLVSAPATNNDPRAVAAGIISAYAQKVAQSIPGVYRSAAAYDLSHAPAVGAKVNELGVALQAALDANGRPAIDAIRLQQVQVYDSSADFFHDRDQDAFVDLRHLATLLAGSTAPALASARARAGELIAALDAGLVIASHQASGDNGEGAQLNLDNAGGLFVFFPSGSSDGDQPTMRTMYLGTTAAPSVYPAFVGPNTWGKFIQNYSAPGISAARGPGRPARGGRPSARPFGTDLTRRIANLPFVVAP